jgi:hypothetical protein
LALLFDRGSAVSFRILKGIVGNSEAAGVHVDKTNNTF